MAFRQRIHRGSASGSPRIKFEHRLVLTNWMIDLFGVASFEYLGQHMRGPDFEGFNEDGISCFHQCPKLIYDRPELTGYGSTKDSVRFPWHEVVKVARYSLSVDAMTRPMEVINKDRVHLSLFEFKEDA